MFNSQEKLLKQRDVLNSLLPDLEEREKIFFHKAAFSKDHKRRIPENEEFFPPYKRDLDRVLHSKAVKRYSDKTQVVYLVRNDHITHRGLHVQLVSAFARGIATILGLNVDLVEAISIGHDVGHPPFGHEGEGYLSQLTQTLGLGAFSHSKHSCKLLSLIEPLNLGFLVYDGFLCHDGGLRERIAKPNVSKAWKGHDAELEIRSKEPEKDFAPASLEGCLVKMCDTVSYLGKDLEDAISIGIITPEEIPSTCLGKTNQEILYNTARDLIASSYQKEYIAFSEEVFYALKTIRKFNFERIYMYPALKVQSEKIKTSYSLLYERLCEDYQLKGRESLLWKCFLHSKSAEYLDSTKEEEKIIDYIAGMTDTYFVQTLENLVIPQKIEL